MRPLTRMLLLAAPALMQGFAASPALAQVEVDQGALDRLTPTAPAAQPSAKPAQPPAKPAKPAPPRRPATRPPVKPAVHPASRPAAHPATTAPAAPPPPIVIAPAPPPPVTMAAPTLPPPHPVPEITVPVRDDAPGDASKIIGGLRITFGAGSADLNPATEAAVQSLARTIGADPASTFNIYAYAAGTPDDPSTPRRMSLSRALAVRAALMSEGIASVRIYPRALGAPAAGSNGGPEDRVDVTQVGIGAAPP